MSSLPRHGESDPHIKGKTRLGEFGKMLGYKVHYEYKGFADELEKAGLPGWTPDVYCEPRQAHMPPLILENDGRVGHSSDAAVAKMQRRDAYFWEMRKIRTIRIKTAELVGAKAASDGQILAEMLYQMLSYDNFGGAVAEKPAVVWVKPDAMPHSPYEPKEASQ